MSGATSIRGTSLDALLAARVAGTPDLEMLCDETGRRRTYAEVAHEVDRVAAGLAAEVGVGPGDVVSWMLPSWIESVVLALALRRLGAVQNPIVPIYRDREVAFCTTQCGASLLVVPGAWRGYDYTAMAERVASANPALRVVSVGRGGLPEADPADLPATPRTAEGRRAGGQPEAHWLCYTSGTTSVPKGARHTDETVGPVGWALGAKLDLALGDKYGIAFPITHIGGLVWIYASLQHGCALALDEAFDPVATTQYFSRERCTHVGAGMPFFLAYLAEQRRHPGTALFPGLKNCPGGGAPKPPTLHAEVRDELGGRGIVSSWGLTEAPILTSCTPDDPDGKLAATEGSAMPGVELIAVTLDGRRAAPGEEGELRAKAPQMMLGYVDPALDAEAFDDDGYFRTGDLGTIDADGFVVITGRLKDVIIRNGENISAKEVEDLLFTHPDVHDVAVVALPDARTGERACAVVSVAPGAEPLAFAEMQAFLRDHGLRIQAIPEQLEIVDVVPRNPSGKITKNVLRDRFRDAPFTRG